MRKIQVGAAFYLLAVVCSFAQPSSQAPQSTVAPKPKPGMVENDQPIARQNWFYSQRAYPLNRIPPGVRQQALERLQEMRRTERERGLESAAAQAITAVPGVWTSIGPQPTRTQGGIIIASGRTLALAVDPRDRNVVYLGGAQGGVWKTTDGGLNWVALTDDRESLAIGSIVLAPSNPDMVYVGTGEAVFSGSTPYYGAGILKSTDGGATWQHLPGSFAFPVGPGRRDGGAYIPTLAVHPTNPDVLLAGVFDPVSETNSGVMRSTDGGVSWSFAQLVGGAPFTGAGAHEVAFATPDGLLAYAALGAGSLTGGDPDNGMYKSTDGGITWARIGGTGANVLPTANVGRIEFAAAPSNPNTVYVGIDSAEPFPLVGRLLGFFKTTDGGQNWIRLTNTPDYCARQCSYDHVIRVHPTNPDIVFAGGAANGFNGEPSFVVRTLDGGMSWEGVARSTTPGDVLHPDTQSMAFSNPATPPLTLYVGNDGGAWSTTDLTAPAGSITWNNLNATLSLTQFYPGLSIHPSTPDIAQGGTQDNSMQVYSGGLEWGIATCGDGGWTAFDPLIPTTVYATCQITDIRRSFDSWRTITRERTGISLSERSIFIPPLVHDPNLSGRLYFGTVRVYQTSSGGDIWTAISPDLSDGTGAVTAMAVAPSDSNVVYAVTTDGRVQRTTNAGAGAGAAWTDLTTADLPPRFLTEVTVDPADPHTAYITFTGFSGFAPGDNKGHVFRTSNGGATWVDISGNLPNTPANDIVVDPDVSGTLYLATDVGVFHSTDNGLTWMTLVTGLPRVAVLSLKLHRNSRILRAATHGRGMWDLQLTNFIPSFNLIALSPVSRAAGLVTPMALTVRGNGFGPGSSIRWNGTALLATTFVSANELQATVSISQLLAAGTAQVTVEQSPGGAVSNALIFSMTGHPPILDAISPTSAPLNGPAFTLTVQGFNFETSSVIRWNGEARPTTFFNANTLTAQIPLSDLAVPQIADVRVFTPVPGGGSSNPQQLVVGSLSNDDFANALAVGGPPFTDGRNTLIASVEAGDPLPSCVQGFPRLADGGRSKSIWYRFTPTANGAVTADTAGSNYDTILSAYTGAAGSLTEVGCNDDVQPGIIRHSQIANLNVIAGQTVFFMVSAYTGDGGDTVFNLSAGISAAPFQLSLSAANATVTAGQSASLTLTVAPQPGGFNSAITFGCTGLPARATCAFTPASVTPGAANTQVALLVSTTAATASAPPLRLPDLPLAPWLLLAALSAALSWRLLRASGRRPAPVGAALLLCLLAGLLLQSACGGGGGGAPRGPTPQPGTPRGTFTVTITGTSGATQQTTSFMLTVN